MKSAYSIIGAGLHTDTEYLFNVTYMQHDKSWTMRDKLIHIVFWAGIRYSTTQSVWLWHRCEDTEMDRFFSVLQNNSELL